MPSLKDPLKVKKVTLKNRIVMPPIETRYATTKGAVTDKLINHYTKRSGSLGLLIIEHSYILPDGKISKKQLGIHEDRLVSGLRKLASSIHATGTTVVAQINHAGRVTTEEIIGKAPVAPSRYGKARKLTIAEIHAITEAFAKAAQRAMRAGFDGVEVHGAHGFLLNQFYSPLANRRTDRYGGSLEKRMKFPLEVAEAVKERVGEKLLLYRLGSDDLDPAGTQIKDSRKFAVKLQAAGVDIIDISGGLCGSRPEHLQGKQGYFIPQAQQIKKAVNIPVIGVGGIKDPAFANSLIKKRKVDLVAVGRELLRHPNWATNAIKRL